MPVDEALNTRMREALAAHVGISEKRMMGGTCFFLNGNMSCGARRHKDGLARFMFRVGKAQENAALADPTAEAVIHGTRKLGGLCAWKRVIAMMRHCSSGCDYASPMPPPCPPKTDRRM